MRNEKTTKPPPKAILFDHKEVLAELIRSQGITEGRWQLIFELGHVSTNINALLTEEGPPVRLPVGMILIQRIGIAPTREESELTLDAAEVEPPKRRSTKQMAKKK